MNTAIFLDLDNYIINRKPYTTIYDKTDDFTFPIVNYQLLEGDVSLVSYCVYICELDQFAPVFNTVFDINEIISVLLNHYYIRVFDITN